MILFPIASHCNVVKLCNSCFYIFLLCICFHQYLDTQQDWYMNLSSGADFAFDGPALLILGDETPEDADAMIESNALQLGAAIAMTGRG